MLCEIPREIAARVLVRHAEGQGYAEELVDAEFQRARLSPPDRGLCQELVYGVIRWQAALDHLIQLRTREPIAKPAVQIFLRLGLYQMFWLDRIPDHASVNETVQLCKQMGFDRQAGFVNAILRGYSRSRPETRALLTSLRDSHPWLAASHPEWLYRRWLAQFGAGDTARLMDWNNQPAKTFARLNTLRCTAEQLRHQWALENVAAKMIFHPWLKDVAVFQLEEHPPLNRLDSLAGGLFYAQDPSTILAVVEMDPQPGERVLDFCAAPGGKTTLIAQLMANQGTVVAQDASPDRLKLLRENVQRLGAVCTQIRPLDQAPLEPVTFDRVLVDAPCSNTGVLRRRLDLRWRLRREQIERLGRDQLKLLEDAARAVKPGGWMVYSTCSLEPVENSGVVQAFLAKTQSFTLEGERSLNPARDGVDGAYVARLRRI